MFFLLKLLYVSPHVHSFNLTIVLLISHISFEFIYMFLSCLVAFYFFSEKFQSQICVFDIATDICYFIVITILFFMRFSLLDILISCFTSNHLTYKYMNSFLIRNIISLNFCFILTIVHGELPSGL